jgi:hypothetical protein
MPVKWNTRRNKQSDEEIWKEREQAEEWMAEMTRAAEQKAAEKEAASKAKSAKFPRRF